MARYRKDDKRKKKRFTKKGIEKWGADMNEKNTWQYKMLGEKNKIQEKKGSKKWLIRKKEMKIQKGNGYA